ncbi:MAG: BACON domain-containing protein, partial [Bacteroidales bacterium]|nr:BACON domain-containing protein [Bacteroidales bacterium]
MKKYIFLFLAIALVMIACQKDEEPYVRFLTTSVALADTGGEEQISFETNSSWVASSSEAWCTITPSRGGASSKSIT